jgi:hypothetical protein
MYTDQDRIEGIGQSSLCKPIRKGLQKVQMETFSKFALIPFTYNYIN